MEILLTYLLLIAFIIIVDMFNISELLKKLKN